jgi:hypothetical protein
MTFINAALQPVPRHPLDHLIAVRDRGRRDRGKRLRAGAEASNLGKQAGRQESIGRTLGFHGSNVALPAEKFKEAMFSMR